MFGGQSTEFNSIRLLHNAEKNTGQQSRRDEERFHELMCGTAISRVKQHVWQWVCRGISESGSV